MRHMKWSTIAKRGLAALLMIVMVLTILPTNGSVYAQALDEDSTTGESYETLTEESDVTSGDTESSTENNMIFSDDTSAVVEETEEATEEAIEGGDADSYTKLLMGNEEYYTSDEEDEIECNTISVNDNSVFIKQATNYTCTLAAAVMMVRRRAIIDGDSKWASYTETDARKVLWLEGSGLYYDKTYKGMRVYHGKFSSTDSQLKSMLKDHPEGIVAYDTSIPHAVLITDYTNGVFYCADPANGYPKGRIPLANSQIGKKYGSQAKAISNIKEYWYLKNKSGGGPGLDYSVTAYAGSFKVISSDKVIRTAPSWSASVSRTVYRNDLLTVVGFCYDSDNNLWYKTAQGDYVYCSAIEDVSHKGYPPSGFGDTKFSAMVDGLKVYDKINGSTVKRVLNKGDVVVTIGYIYSPQGSVWYEVSGGGFIRGENLNAISRNRTNPTGYMNVSLRATVRKKITVHTDYNDTAVAYVEEGSYVTIKGYTYNKNGELWYITEKGCIDPFYLDGDTSGLSHMNNTVMVCIKNSEQKNGAYSFSSKYKAIGTDEIVASIIGDVKNFYGETWCVTWDRKFINANDLVPYSYSIRYDSNGGSGIMYGQTCTYKTSFKLNPNHYVRSGYRFVGWNLKRKADGKWHVKSQGWFTDAELQQKGYEKQLYVNEWNASIDYSWATGCMYASDYVFVAVWEKQENIPVGSIILNRTSMSVATGKSIVLTAKIEPVGATNTNVSWESSDTGIATVDSTGCVTGVAPGSATITCAAKDGSGVKAICKVTVTKPTATVKVSKITLNKKNVVLTKGKSISLTRTVSPTNATNKTVSFKSSNTKVATVDGNGKVTAKGAGTATITCTAKDGSGIKAICKVTVYSNTEAFVARIYTKALGRNPESAGLKYWTNEIQTGKRTPVKVAEEFFFAPEFVNKKLNNTEYVKVLYRTFMGREYDKGGLNYWVGRLNKGESRKSVLEAFAGCPEFQKIVKSFGL